MWRKTHIKEVKSYDKKIEMDIQLKGCNHSIFDIRIIQETYEVAKKRELLSYSLDISPDSNKGGPGIRTWLCS